MRKKIILMISIIFILIILIFVIIRNYNTDDIPKVYIEGNISKMTTKKDERKIKIIYKSKDLKFESYALIKIQGSYSLNFEKKNYNIKLYDDESFENKFIIDVGYGELYKYCLKANWSDKTHSRNIVTARIMSDIQNKYNLFVDTPNNGLIDGYPIELYENGKFLGLYTWNIPKDESMFNLDKDNPNHIALSGVDYTEATNFNQKATFDDWEVEAGPENEETLNKLNTLIDFVSNSSDEEFKNNFEKHFDLDATLNYYIMLHTFLLHDNVSKNMILVTYDGQKWYPSLYDLDCSFAALYNGTEFFHFKENVFDKQYLLWSKFERVYYKEIAERYFELRKDILTVDYIMNEFNNFYNTIPKSTFEKEIKRWKDIPGFNLNQIEAFLNTRLPHIDQYMNDLANGMIK